MAIEFNTKDFQMTAIRAESKLHNLQTKNPFRIYGLTRTGNPLIHLSYNYDTVDEDFDENMQQLIEFFEANNLEFVWESGGGSAKVCIGIRRDLRDHVLLTSAILQTIIYSLEGRLVIRPDHKIKGIPKFPKSRN